MANMSTPSPAQSRMTDLFMLADVPWMATVVMAAAQPFGQLRESAGLPSYTPLLVALIASMLIALYWVRVAQHVSAGAALLVVPVVTMSLFSASIGANNVIGAATAGDPRVQNFQHQTELLQQQLELERQKTAIFVPPGNARAPSSFGFEPSAHVQPSPRGIFSWFISSAYAREPSPPPSPPRSNAPELVNGDQQEKLRAVEAKQKELERKRQDLVKQQQQPGGGAPLWKSW